MKYKIGDKVVLDDAETLKGTGIDLEYAHETAIIDEIEDNSYYRAVVEKDGEDWYIDDDDIDHEATARLNEPKYELKTDDNGIYLTSQLLGPLINSTANKEDIKKGSDKMDKIRVDRLIGKWKIKRIDEIDLKYNKQIREAKKEDAIQKIIDKHQKEMLKEIKTLKTAKDFIVSTYTPQYTEETEIKVTELRKKQEKEIEEIINKVDETIAILDAVTSEEKVFDILIKQKIIDNNYNIL